MPGCRGRRPHRLSLLGGTTDRRDCAIAVGAIVRRRDRVRGPAIDRFERAFAGRVGVAHGVGFGTGRVGLTAILGALGVGPGDEVLVPVPTHVVVPNAVRFAGARPVFVDCDPATLNIDLDGARGRITERTRILLLQHTFGIPAPIDDAVELAREQDLALVEDCVHALGATWRRRPVGGFGAASFFSTEETKVISTTLGGVVVTDDDALAARLRATAATCRWPSERIVQGRMAKLLAYHVLTWPPVHRYSRAVYDALGRRHPLPLPVTAAEGRGELPDGYFERLSNAQAAVGLHQLAGLDANLAHRRRIAGVYAAELPPGVRVRVPAAADPSFVRYPVLVRDREEAEEALRAHTVVGTWFSSVLEEADDPAVAGYEAGSCPVAEVVARHLVNLPTHQRVSVAQARSMACAVGPVAVGWEELACPRW